MAHNMVHNQTLYFVNLKFWNFSVLTNYLISIDKIWWIISLKVREWREFEHLTELQSLEDLGQI